MTVTCSKDDGVKATVNQLIEDIRQEWTAQYRRHGLGNVIDDASQAGAETARKDDRLHHEVLGNICASMIWQMA